MLENISRKSGELSGYGKYCPSSFEILLFLILVFQPYIGISFLPSDIQPFSLIYAIYLILKCSHNFRIYSISLGPLLLMVCAFVSLFHSVLMVELGYKQLIFGADHISMYLRVAWGYITPFVMICAFVIISPYITSKHVVCVYRVIIGIVLIGYALNFFGLTSFIQLFVNRAIYEGGPMASRGLTGFFPEQSRISEQLSLLLIFLAIFSELNAKRAFVILALGFVSFAGQFFISVGMAFCAFFLSTIFVFIFHGASRVRIGVLCFCGIAAGLSYVILIETLVSVLSYLVIDLGLPSRGILAAITILETGFFGFSSDFGAIQKLSGVTGAVATLIANPFSFEAGAALDSNHFALIGQSQLLVESLFFGNYQVVGFHRPNGTFGTIITDFGIIGFVFVSWMSYFFLEAVNRFRYCTVSVFAGVFLYFYFWLKISLVNPGLWVLYAALVLRSRGFLLSGITR